MTNRFRAPPPVTLRRTLGLWEVTAGGVGIIIGAGIYVLIGAATAQAGAAVWLAFVLAALLSALSGLSYAELAALYPSAASEYTYTRQVFPERFAFLVGWVMVAGLVVASAAVALGFARYLGQFIDAPARPLALMLLAVVALVAMRGVQESARLALALSLVQVGGLLAVIVIGAPHVGQVNLLEGARVGGVIGAAALVFFAFIGFDEVCTLAEETRDPTRTVPRALLLALAVSTALYVAVAVTAVSVLGAERLGASPRPLADVMGHAIGPRSGDVIAAIAIISTLNTTLIALTAASRMLYGIARGGSLPAGLATIHPRTRTPVRAIAAGALLAGGFVLLGDLTLIASVTDFAIYLVFLAVNVTVIVLRRRQPNLPRPFRTPGSVRGVPVIPLLAIAAVLVMISRLDVAAMALGVALCVIGWGVGALRKGGEQG